MNDIEKIRIEQREKKRLVKRARTKILRCFYKLADRFTEKKRFQQYKGQTFTIISNNCWGGTVYEYCGLNKLSPTVGSYFFAKDYIKFVSNIEYYLSCKLKMITYNESRYKDILILKGQQDVPVGVLDDIEIIFLHYKDPKVAEEKWNKRLSRVNRDNLIVKFSEMNLCEKEDLYIFNSLPYKNKIIFTKQRYEGLENSVVIPFYAKSSQIIDDIPEWRLKRKEIWKILKLN
ncbi:MAG: DUF1919 domain-containing protein [Eubacteriales bacterium]